MVELGVSPRHSQDCESECESNDRVPSPRLSARSPVNGPNMSLCNDTREGGCRAPLEPSKTPGSANEHTASTDGKSLMIQLIESTTSQAESLSATTSSAAEAVSRVESSSGEDVNRALELKDEGNLFFRKGQIGQAIEKYSEALDIDAQSHVLFSNRAAAYAQQGEFEKSLEDATQCIALDPRFMKGYTRSACALLALKRPHEAVSVLEKALKISLIEGLNREIMGHLELLLEQCHRAILRGVLRGRWTSSEPPRQLTFEEEGAGGQLLMRETSPLGSVQWQCRLMLPTSSGSRPSEDVGTESSVANARALYSLELSHQDLASKSCYCFQLSIEDPVTKQRHVISDLLHVELPGPGVGPWAEQAQRSPEQWDEHIQWRLELLSPRTDGVLGSTAGSSTSCALSFRKAHAEEAPVIMNNQARDKFVNEQLRSYFCAVSLLVALENEHDALSALKDNLLMATEALDGYSKIAAAKAFAFGIQQLMTSGDVSRDLSYIDGWDHGEKVVLEDITLSCLSRAHAHLKALGIREAPAEAVLQGDQRSRLQRVRNCLFNSSQYTSRKGLHFCIATAATLSILFFMILRKNRT